MESYHEAIAGPLQELLAMEAGMGAKHGGILLPHEGGTTASVLLAVGALLTVAWVGDSRCVVARRRYGRRVWQPVCVTTDDDCRNAGEVARMAAAGATCAPPYFAVPGAEGMIQVTRSLGDCAFHTGGAVTAAPHVAVLHLDPAFEYCAIAASDGFWGACSVTDALSVAAHALDGRRGDLSTHHPAHSPRSLRSAATQPAQGSAAPSTPGSLTRSRSNSGGSRRAAPAEASSAGSPAVAHDDNDNNDDDARAGPSLSVLDTGRGRSGADRRAHAVSAPDTLHQDNVGPTPRHDSSVTSAHWRAPTLKRNDTRRGQVAPVDVLASPEGKVVHWNACMRVADALEQRAAKLVRLSQRPGHSGPVLPCDDISVVVLHLRLPLPHEVAAAIE